LIVLGLDQVCAISPARCAGSGDGVMKCMRVSVFCKRDQCKTVRIPAWKKYHQLPVSIKRGDECPARAQGGRIMGDEQNENIKKMKRTQRRMTAVVVLATDKLLGRSRIPPPRQP